MLGFIKIESDGPKIVSTNYWETDYARNGVCYLSINAGCYRLLLPESLRKWISEMKTGQEVVISRGPTPRSNPPKSDALEILFEDKTNSPFVVLIGPEQVERMPSDEDRGWKGIMDVYCGNHAEPVLVFTRVYYRKVKELPCHKPVGNDDA
jgi:hypothetical protein